MKTKVSTLQCSNCKHHQVSVYPASLKMADLECGSCAQIGYMKAKKFSYKITKERLEKARELCLKYEMQFISSPDKNEEREFPPK